MMKNIQIVTTSFKKFSDYDHYLLYLNPSLENTDDIPTAGVRLNDMSVGKVLTAGIRPSVLNSRWPAEFDAAEMVRATRYP